MRRGGGYIEQRCHLRAVRGYVKIRMDAASYHRSVIGVSIDTTTATEGLGGGGGLSSFYTL